MVRALYALKELLDYIPFILEPVVHLLKKDMILIAWKLAMEIDPKRTPSFST